MLGVSFAVTPARQKNVILQPPRAPRTLVLSADPDSLEETGISSRHCRWFGSGHGYGPEGEAMFFLSFPGKRAGIMEEWVCVHRRLVCTTFHRCRTVQRPGKDQGTNQQWTVFKNIAPRKVLFISREIIRNHAGKGHMQIAKVSYEGEPVVPRDRSVWVRR